MSVQDKSKKQKIMIGITAILVAIVLILKGEDKSISENPIINQENIVEEISPLSQENMVEEIPPLSQENIIEEIAPLDQENIVEEIIPLNQETPKEEEPRLNEQQVLEAIREYMIEVLHNGETGTVYSIQFDKLEQVSSDMPIEARTTEIVGILENNQENIYQITMSTELAYIQNEYIVEYRQEMERVLLSTKDMPEEENQLENQVKKLKGLIDGKYEVVLDMSELGVSKYGATSFRGYYTRYPDNIYEIVVVPNELNDLVLDEYFDGQKTGSYVLNREDNRFIGIFTNESTNAMYDVVLEIEE